MASSVVILYNVAFTKEQNALMDDIGEVLDEEHSTEVATFSDVQLVKHGLDITLKLPMTQELVNRPTFNYVHIMDRGNTIHHYYYVIDVEWTAENTIKLVLSMDTLNTFNYMIFNHFTDHTKITREHKDRFYKPTGYVKGNGGQVLRKVDKIDEGLQGLVKYKKDDTILDENDLKWYIVYATNQDTSLTNPQPVNVYFVPEDDYDVIFMEEEYELSQLINRRHYGIILMTNGSFNISGDSYTNTSTEKHMLIINQSDRVVVYKLNISNFSISTTGNVYDQADIIRFSQVTYATSDIYAQITDPDSFVNVSTQTREEWYNSTDKTYRKYDEYGTSTIDGFDKIDRTKSYLIKIIECPYCPIDINQMFTQGKIGSIYTNEVSTDYIYMLKLIDMNSDYSMNLTNYNIGELSYTIPASNDATFNTLTLNRESKLYHSDLYSYQFVYDSFVLDYPLENIKQNVASATYAPYTITYKQTNTINSNLLFKVNHFSLVEADKTDLLGNVLVCSRNNEVPIYNSSYLDYLRTGYNYDVKARNRQTAQDWIGVGLNTVGSAVSFGVSSVKQGSLAGLAGVSMATSAISGITSAIFNRINANEQIARKKSEAKATAVSVSGSDDLDLMNYYLGNKLHNVTYDITDGTKSAVFDLFYRNGYASNRSAIPDLDTRVMFNYIQCEAYFNNEDNPVWKDYLADVKARFELGVTVFHRYTDFKQTKENWETWV